MLTKYLSAAVGVGLATLLASDSAVSYALYVDFNHGGGGGSPTQAGWTGLEVAPSNALVGSPVTFSDVPSSFGPIDISLAASGSGVGNNDPGIGSRDRATPTGPLSDLIRDFAFALQPELSVTLSGLGPKRYFWTGFFHDSDRTQGEYSIDLSVDGGATFTSDAVSGIVPSTYADPPGFSGVTEAGVDFVVTGGTDVVIRIREINTGTSVATVLNGFTLIPEPATLTLPLAGLAGLGLRRFTARR